MNHHYHTKIYCMVTISLTNYPAHISINITSQLVLCSYHVHTATSWVVSWKGDKMYWITVCYVMLQLGFNTIGQLLIIISILLSRTISKLYGLGCMVSTDIRLQAGLSQNWGSIPSKNFSLPLCPACRLWHGKATFVNVQCDAQKTERIKVVGQEHAA